MILSVAHRTTYRYDAPIRMAVQSLRLTPSDFAGQRVIGWQVAVEGGQKGAGFRDGAGDWIESWSVRGPADHVTVTVAGSVETADLAGLLTGHREAVNPAVYLRETLATRADAQLSDLARAAEAEAAEPLARAHALSRLVAESIAYRPGATQAHTTAAEAMALGEGVCQDHAHALIACARAVGFPARYVSGYLMMDDRTHQDATHAWAEAHFDNIGWIGFDVSNGHSPDQRYIRVATGLDYRDAAPVRGMRYGAAQENLVVQLQVQQ